MISVRKKVVMQV